MQKYLKTLGSGLKYAAYMGLGTVAVGFGYLQYINSQIGPIDVNRDETTKFYISQYKMDSKEANRMYYWMMYDIALMRIFTYFSYSSYCQKLNKKIVGPIIQNYKEGGVYERIEKNQDKPDGKTSRALFKEVDEVRKKNFQSLTTYEYVVKEVRKQQKLMDTRKILGLQKSTLDMIGKIHGFICETGSALKQEEILSYMKDLPILEERLPGDVLHKILFI